MKKFLLPVLLLIPFWVNAQVYHPLVDSGAVWNVEQGHCDFFSGFCLWHCDYKARKYFFGNDTLIENHSGKTLWRQVTYIGYVCDDLFDGGNIDDPPEMIGAMWEDSSKKVWLSWLNDNDIGPCQTFSVGQGFLLYDFSLQEGDTMTYLTFYGEQQIMVTLIDSIQLLDGQWRRRYHFQDGEIMIEGIGFDSGLLAPLVNYFECASWLSCYRLNDELLYHGFTNFGHLNCDSITAVQNIRLNEVSFQIHPDPASDFFSVNFSSSNFFSAQIKITDVLERNSFIHEIKSNQPLQIATEKFSGNSMLFCELWQEGRLIGVKKVLIQK